MPSLGEGDLGDFVDPTVKYVPLEPLANNMNEIEPERLRQYLDPEFLDATPDSRTIDSGQLEIEENERMDYDFDLDAELEEELKEDDLKAAMMAPREYQFELFQKALEGNAIAVFGYRCWQNFDLGNVNKAYGFARKTRTVDKTPGSV